MYGALLVLTWLGFTSVPSGFIPQQDKQYLVAYAQLPEAATLDRTEEVIRQMDAIMLAEPGVAHAVSFPGLSINGFVNSPNSGIAFAGLADFSKDGKHVTTSGRSAWEIAASLNQKLASIQDAYIAVFPPPAVQGLGQIGGFKVQIEDRAGSASRRSTRRRRRSSPPRARSAGARERVLGLRDQRAADPRRTSTATRRKRRACSSRTCSRRCRSISARSTSTTSTASAAPTR